MRRNLYGNKEKPHAEERRRRVSKHARWRSSRSLAMRSGVFGRALIACRRFPAGRQGEVEAGAATRVERLQGGDEAAAPQVEQVAAEAAEQSLAALRRRRIDAHHHAAADVAEALALHHAVDGGERVGEVEAGEIQLVIGLAVA